MVMIHAGSIAEQIAAWILDADGDPIDLTGVTIALALYDPSSGDDVLANAGAATGSPGTGTGVEGDDPNVDIVWHADVADLTPGRYRLRATCTVGGKALIRTWPIVIRP